MLHVVLHFSYLVTQLMGADLNSILKCQKLTDEHVQFLIYQILRGLKVSLFSDDVSIQIILKSSVIQTNYHPELL